MKILKCKLCSGELDIIGTTNLVNKKVKCRNCNFTNEIEDRKEPEVIVYKKRNI